MRKSDKTDGVFIFPLVEDTQIVSRDEIVAVVCPTKIQRDRHFFSVEKFNCH